MKKLISLLLMGILMVGILAACGTGGEEAENAGDSNKKVLKMATSADYAPFEYIDTKGSGDFTGIDIEIANAITEKLGYELEIQDMDFSGLISALQSGQADFVMAAMSATEDRKKSVDFSDVYYTSKHVVVSKKDSGIRNGRRLSRFKSWSSIGIYSRGEDERTFRSDWIYL